MKKIILCVLLIMGVQAAIAQPTTANRLPGANNDDVEWCKANWESLGYGNLGKCANMTPADFQFICQRWVDNGILGFKNVGECMRWWLSSRD